jgi:hypothetical protein
MTEEDIIDMAAGGRFGIEQLGESASGLDGAHDCRDT